MSSLFSLFLPNIQNKSITNLDKKGLGNIVSLFRFFFLLQDPPKRRAALSLPLEQISNFNTDGSLEMSE